MEKDLMKRATLRSSLPIKNGGYSLLRFFQDTTVTPEKGIS